MKRKDAEELLDLIISYGDSERTSGGNETQQSVNLFHDIRSRIESLITEDENEQRD